MKCKEFTGSIDEFRESVGLSVSVQAIINCLRCCKDFRSIDKINIRLCRDCRYNIQGKIEY